jgi:phosphatidate cytidylyltransferase
MLAKRLIVVIILIPFGAFVVTTGGWVLAITTAGVLGYAAWEYHRMFRAGGYNPSGPLLIAGVAGLVLIRQQWDFSGTNFFLSFFILATMIVQIKRFESGQKTPAEDFNITLGGLLYLGWLGAYTVSLSNLPDGEWWLLLVLPTTWIGDGAAYFFGSKFGRHKLSPNVSPNKTWEGYLGGVVAAALGTMLLAALWELRAPVITPMKGLIIGLVIAITSPIGDLGESMLKRSFGFKDTSRALPGHGGVLDRIDSWLWAAPIGYYLIYWLWI